MLNPIFDKGRLLRSDMLNALRDNPLGVARLHWLEYGDGIINGFEVSTSGKKFFVSPGILKSGGELFFSTGVLDAELRNGRNIVYLKRLRAEHESGSSLNFELEVSAKEIADGVEMFRCDVNGAIEQYASFDDLLKAQRNRIDRRRVAFGIRYGSSLDPKIFSLYARKVLEREASVEEKIFAYLCLNESLTRATIDRHFGSGLTNLQLIDAMRSKVESMGSSGSNDGALRVDERRRVDQIEVW